MNKYEISKSVDLNSNDCKPEIAITSIGTLNKHKNGLVGLLAGLLNPVAGIGILVADTIKYFKDKDVIKIETKNELKKYKLCIGNTWNYKTIYVEHPKLKNCLIPKTEYSSFILRDMIADIANYITSNVELEELTIGIMSSKGGSADISVPVNDIATNTKFNFNISKNFCYHIEDTKINKDAMENYWIDIFPQFKQAISSNAKKVDMVEETNFSASLGIDLKEIGGGKIGANSNITFFLNYSVK